MTSMAAPFDEKPIRRLPTGCGLRSSQVGISRRALVRAAAACILVVLGLAGCHPNRGPADVRSKVERGEAVETGSPIHDEYFISVQELQRIVTTARGKDRDAQQALAGAMGLPPAADTKQLMSKLREKVRASPPMRMDLNARAKPNTVSVSLARPPEADDILLGFMAMLEAATNAELLIVERMKDIPERARRVYAVGTTLVEGAPQDFALRPETERQRLFAELKAAQLLLHRTATDAEALSTASTGFVAQARQIVQSGPSKMTSQGQGRTPGTGSSP